MPTLTITKTNTKQSDTTTKTNYY